MEVLINFIIDALLLAFPVFFVLLVERRKLDFSEFGFRSDGALSDIWLTAKIFLALLMFSFLLSLAFGFFRVDDFEPVKKTVQEITVLPPLMLIYFFVVRVFIEEFFFRAFLVPRAGPIVSSMMFGLAHIGYGSAGEAIGATVLGFLLAIAYQQNRKIMPNFAAHLLYNFVVVLLLL